MIAEKKNLILSELLEGTGAAMAATTDHSGIRSGLKIWFDDLEERHGPVANLRPYGLKGHKVDLTFGNFSGSVLEQIRKAAPEDMQLARALIASIRNEFTVEVTGQSLSEWCIVNGDFRMTATIRDLNQPLEDAAVIATCREVIVPMMAAMAELIGYDVVDTSEECELPAFEGAIQPAIIKRRERNPRNRLLCVRIHGEKCAACCLEPRLRYSGAGSIIEVHHIEPVATLKEPRPYDPRTDLVPLCPNCHRAIHSRKPIPFSVEELRNILEASCD